MTSGEQGPEGAGPGFLVPFLPSPPAPSSHLPSSAHPAVVSARGSPPANGLPLQSGLEKLKGALFPKRAPTSGPQGGIT